MAHLNGGGFGQEIVGESNYFKILARCFKAGQQDKNGKRSYITISLVLENHNKYDKNAVAVVSDFGTVGYLPRADAKLYRKLYGNNETHSTDAVIYSQDGTKFGVWIDVCLDDDCMDEDWIDEPDDNSQSPSTFIQHSNTPVERPIILEPKQPPKPPKAWKEQTSREKIAVGLAWIFLAGCVYFAFALLCWFFGLFV